MIAWFNRRQQQYPDRFFSFLQDEVDEGMLRRLAEFLKLKPDPVWIQAVLQCCQINPSYEYDNDQIIRYHQLIGQYFNEQPQLGRRLKQLTIESQQSQAGCTQAN